MKNENVIFKVCEILNFTYFFGENSRQTMENMI